MPPHPVVSAEIYVIPLETGRYIIYAPLRKAAFVGNARVVNFLAGLKEGNYDATLDADGSTTEFLRRLEILDAGPEQQPEAVFSDTHDPVSLTLFLTTACNLRCTYCYAAAGDGPVRSMSLETALRGVDFIVQNSLKRRTGFIDINFHGGGEPTQNWRVLTGAHDHARRLADQHGLKLTCYTATNAVFSDKQLDWIVAHLQGASVSFDGLPEAHDTHRISANGKGSSERVMHTLRRFDEAGFSYGIRMTVTADMIARLPDSIEFICSRFRPGQIQAEPAYQIGRWAGAPSAETDAFIAAFREAQSRAKKHGCEVTFSAARTGTLTNHFCGATQDLFALTPDGTASACYEVFDEANPRAKIFLYGNADSDGAWKFDMEKLAFLRSHSVDKRDYCEGCFARWTCGGDCLHKALTVCGDDGFSGTDRCNIIRELTKDQILARIAEAGGVCWHGLPGDDEEGSTCPNCNEMETKESEA
ncbi:uncharacterized protein M2103_002062 [Ereboglobus sp. PH5-5]|uniref:radical SAM/SPASM domain-containing protein n=1 Tax=Ereboglobus sp. PH5-5 TaxID=2940529 RepID=UPI0024066D79|nr:radical SAM protein [Ereboglobus sp. PH5-5]MDF9833829.1 uncharacterized protein [Ereboglobus sp. PH5-5]